MNNNKNIKYIQEGLQTPLCLPYILYWEYFAFVRTVDLITKYKPDGNGL